MLGLQHRLTVYQHTTRFDPLLESIAGMLGDHLGQHLIKASTLRGDQVERAIIARIVF